jgi:dUTP pyrophosphatase
MFESGSFVAEHVTETDDDQVQPNGVDLTLEAVYEQREPGRIGRDDKEIGERRELETEGVAPRATESSSGQRPRGQVAADAPETYYLTAGGYVVQYAETVHVPENHVGYLYPRSSLLRNSCMLNTAVWDAGYEGKGEGLLEVHHDIELEKGARIAQLVLAEADHESTYAGSYQGENLGLDEF